MPPANRLPFTIPYWSRRNRNRPPPPSYTPTPPTPSPSTQPALSESLPQPRAQPHRSRTPSPPPPYRSPSPNSDLLPEWPFPRARRLPPPPRAPSPPLLSDLPNFHGPPGRFTPAEDAEFGKLVLDFIQALSYVIQHPNRIGHPDLALENWNEEMRRIGRPTWTLGNGPFPVQSQLGLFRLRFLEHSLQHVVEKAKKMSPWEGVETDESAWSFGG